MYRQRSIYTTMYYCRRRNSSRAHCVALAVVEFDVTRTRCTRSLSASRSFTVTLERNVDIPQYGYNRYLSLAGHQCGLARDMARRAFD